MVATIRTVFEGDRVEEFQAEIVAIMDSFLGPHQDLILARLKGEKVEFTGVAAGMSGSPVYIGGRLVGALSYRMGAFLKEPIAGITPIEYMLKIGTGAKVSPGAAGSPASPRGGAMVGAVSGGLEPIETPVVATGVPEAALRIFASDIDRLGISAAIADPLCLHVKRRSSGSGVSSFRFQVSGSTSEFHQSDSNNLKPET